MRFIVDAQLPPALARWLILQGNEANHVADVGMANASDSDIWDFALQVNAVIVTKDEDFAQRKAMLWRVHLLYGSDCLTRDVGICLFGLIKCFQI